VTHGLKRTAGAERINIKFCELNSRSMRGASYQTLFDDTVFANILNRNKIEDKQSEAIIPKSKFILYLEENE
jgi:hypothetical protein